MDSVTQIVCVYVDNECYGITTDCVQEVLSHADVTPVPLAPDFVIGLINLRGQIVVTISLRKLLGRIESAVNPGSSLIIKAEQETLNILVDRVEDVIQLPSDNLLSLEPSDSGRPAIIKGAFKTSSRIIHVLDATSLSGRTVTSH